VLEPVTGLGRAAAGVATDGVAFVTLTVAVLLLIVPLVAFTVALLVVYAAV
jgi:hypothetical protein